MNSINYATNAKPVRPPVKSVPQQPDLPELSGQNGTTRHSSVIQRVKMQITPEQAAEWLSNNGHNRNLSESVVFTYACDMEAGRWKYNFVAIVISKNGTLIDGQHRLKACVVSGKPFWSDVVFGADIDLQDTIDIGHARTTANVAQIERVPNATRVSALATMVLQDAKLGIDKMTNYESRPTKPEHHDFRRRNESELQSALVLRMDHICSPRVLDFCNFTFRRIGLDLAGKFISDLTIGNGVTTDNPVWLLRKRLNENAASKSKLPPKELVALIFKTWNAYISGKPMRVLRWNGQSGEEFPKPEHPLSRGAE